MLLFLFKYNVFHPSGKSLLKAEFFYYLRELILAAFYFAGFFFLRMIIFAD